VSPLSVITITGSSDHDRPELMITFAGIRTGDAVDLLTVPFGPTSTPYPGILTIRNSAG